MLKHHAHFTAHIINIFEIIGERHAINNDVTLLVLLKPINAADQG
jgi:hypothetical protein